MSWHTGPKASSSSAPFQIRRRSPVSSNKQAVLPIYRYLKTFRLKNGAPPRRRCLEALHKWICYHTNVGKQIDGSCTVQFAKKLQIKANKHLADDEKLVLNFSDWWMFRFKARYGLSFKKVHGAAMRADGSAIASKLPESRAKIRSYHPDGIWSADEFGDFSRQALGWTLSQKVCAPSGHKKDKMRIIFLLLVTPAGKRGWRLRILESHTEHAHLVENQM